MGSVGSSTAVHSSLADGVVDDASINVESFGLSVGSQVDEHLTYGLAGLLGPSTESGGLMRLDLSVSGTTIPVEGDDFCVLETVLKVADSLVELKPLNCAGNIVAVLIVSSQVTNSAFSGYRKQDKN